MVSFGLERTKIKWVKVTLKFETRTVRYERAYRYKHLNKSSMQFARGNEAK